MMTKPKSVRKPVKDHEEESSGAVGFDEDAREIYLSGTVDQDKAGALIAAARRLDRSRGPMAVIISSTGGGEGAGWAIYDVLKLCRNHVIGLAYGECQSIAALILQACGTRLLSPNCRFMIHNGSVEMATTITQLPAIAQETLDVTKAYYEAIAARSGLSMRKVKALCDAESFMGPEKACQLGLADGIITPTPKRKSKGKRK